MELSAGIRKRRSENDFWNQLKLYYNGYSWDGLHFIFNPFSVLNFFNLKSFAPYWIDSGSPSFIVEYAKKHELKLDKLEGIIVDKAFMSHKDIDDASPESFLMQAGYLTIKENDEFEYTLDFPNYEVRYSFNYLILSSRYNVKNEDYIGVRRAMRKALQNNDTKDFIDQLKVIFSSVTHHHFDVNKNEYFYSALLLMYLQASGFDVVAEKTTGQGRLDLMLFWKKERVYILELKMGSSLDASNQIKNKNYHGRYRNRECILIGLSINYEKRNITDSLWEVVK